MLPRRARAPKPTPSVPCFRAFFLCDFRTAPAPSCGCGSCGTSSPGCRGHRTFASRPCDRRHGPHPLPGPCALSWRTRDRRAPAGAASAAGPCAKGQCCTSSARTVPRCCAGRRAADERRSSRRSPARSSLGAGTALTAFGSRAITSGQNKKPAPTRTALADHVAQALRHRHSSIFTMDSRPQTLQ